jgi:hypothetical protein
MTENGKIDVVPEDVSLVEEKFVQAQQAKMVLADSVLAMFQAVASVQSSGTEFRNTLDTMAEKYKVPDNDPDVTWEMSREDGGFVRRGV